MLYTLKIAHIYCNKLFETSWPIEYIRKKRQQVRTILNIGDCPLTGPVGLGTRVVGAQSQAKAEAINHRPRPQP